MAAVPSTPLLVSVEEYIARFVDGGEKPTCEYEDGELIPKPMPTRNHSQVQVNIAVFMRARYVETLRPLTELTTRLRKTQFYVPDVVVYEVAKPIKGRYPGPDDPVLLCVEIMSPPGRAGKLFGKCEEYHTWGVPYCWVINPDRKIAWEYFPDDVEPRKVEEALTAGPIRMGFGDLFWDVQPES
jgi:Uma2 family endonuclease